MDQIKLKNFRCFRDEQIATLAPLTLLVGENSTGKTSFMAMIRAIWDTAYGIQIPDFKEDPYDLGSFDEIAHHRGAKGSRADTFEAEFTTRSGGGTAKNKNKLHRFRVVFERMETIPVPVERRLTVDEYSIEEKFKSGQPWQVVVKTPKGSWKRLDSGSDGLSSLDSKEPRIRPFYYAVGSILFSQNQGVTPLGNSPNLPPGELQSLDEVMFSFRHAHFRTTRLKRPFASAPVRSKPSRTYDPSRPTPDSEGAYVPMYLAKVYFQDKEAWKVLKLQLEKFGQAAGLFDEISVKPLGKRVTEPFQVQVRKFGGGLKGPKRNLIDVGYGVSQVLPVITELRREGADGMFLLQQPEVHLHPSAQAALGSLFCGVASSKLQLIVETHSDHILDRVRMDIRDGKTQLKPNDVSILFFERRALDVHIHSLRLDEEGNVLDAPGGYRSFFMQETQRSLGL